MRSSGRVEMEIDSELVESSFLKLGCILITGLVLESGGSKEGTSLVAAKIFWTSPSVEETIKGETERFDAETIHIFEVNGPGGEADED